MTHRRGIYLNDMILYVQTQQQQNAMPPIRYRIITNIDGRKLLSIFSKRHYGIGVH